MQILEQQSRKTITEICKVISDYENRNSIVEKRLDEEKARQAEFKVKFGENIKLLNKDGKVINI